jgi:hypothetical protein
MSNIRICPCGNTTSKEKIDERKELKRVLGNKCQLCGFNKYLTALEFHHKPSGKIVLLCANCHRAYTYKEIKDETIENLQSF